MNMNRDLERMKRTQHYQGSHDKQGRDDENTGL
jgi:hypothetical protein